MTGETIKTLAEYIAKLHGTGRNFGTSGTISGSYCRYQWGRTRSYQRIFAKRD
jgi:hypothetical protein